MSALHGRPTRRALVAGAGLMLAPRGLFAATGTRRFTVIRAGDEIGTQTVDVRADGQGGVAVAIDVSLRVKVLGITAYRYEMSNRETWRGGRLIAMDCRTDDDGDADFARAKAVGDKLEIEGSAWSGAVAGDAVSTTYWSTDFLERSTWINSQTGVPIMVTASPLGAGTVDGAAGSIATERWRVVGEKFDVTLHYAHGEWVSIEFTAGGEPASYRPDAIGGDFAPVWAASL